MSLFRILIFVTGSFLIFGCEKKPLDLTKNNTQGSLPLNQGSAKEQFELGNKYFSGKDIPQNYTEAFKYFRLAADQGDAPAQNNLGFMYENGYGVKQDYKEAAKLYLLGACRIIDMSV